MTGSEMTTREIAEYLATIAFASQGSEEHLAKELEGGLQKLEIGLPSEGPLAQSG